MSDRPLHPTDGDDEAEEAAREMRAALPTIFIDTWVTLSWKGHIRIALAERLYRHDQYRAAFVMELDDAERFAKHLLRTVKKRKDRDAELEAEDESPQGDI